MPAPMFAADWKITHLRTRNSLRLRPHQMTAVLRSIKNEISRLEYAHAAAPDTAIAFRKELCNELMTLRSLVRHISDNLDA